MAAEEGGLKRARTNPPACCSCMEENMPYLVMTGCSNRHLICHVCARMFVSSKIVMNQFPRYFPGKVSTMGDLECPLCRESIHGVSNMFVSDGIPEDTLHDCPYSELVDCKVAKLKLKDLQKHLITAHNHTVKCPNCLEWLTDDEKNTGDLLQFHIMKQCQKVKCHGCDRTGNMINMYMHSAIGSERVCESAKDMFRLFGENLAESSFMFSDTEDLTYLSFNMLRWTVQYIYQRSVQKSLRHPQIPLSTNASTDKTFRRIFNGFVLQMFCTLHVDGDDVSPMLNKLLRLSTTSTGEYEENILLCISGFAQKRQLRLDNISTLPFFYRILVMSLSDCRYSQKLLKSYPKDIAPEEQILIGKIIHLYQKLIPHHPLPPEHWRDMIFPVPAEASPA